jgi:hypothetical protein
VTEDFTNAADNPERENQGADEQRQKDDERNLSSPGRRFGDARKTEQCGNQRNNEKINAR